MNSNKLYYNYLLKYSISDFNFCTFLFVLIHFYRKKSICCTKGEKSTEVADQKRTETRNRISHINRSYDFVDDECIDASFKGNYDSPNNMPDQDEGNPKETTYDITGNDRKALKQEQDKIYNKLQSENTPIYDLSSDQSKTELRAFDDTYNKTEEPSMNTIEESPYNHTNSDPFERKPADQLYNTASFQ
jgi:hypothetical protein